LPPAIAKLTEVKHLVLYGTNLVRIPPEIGAMSALEVFAPYPPRPTSIVDACHHRPATTFRPRTPVAPASCSRPSYHELWRQRQEARDYVFGGAAVPAFRSTSQC
jgi:hypothetical protein